MTLWRFLSLSDYNYISHIQPILPLNLCDIEVSKFRHMRLDLHISRALLQDNCLPLEIFDMDYTQFEEFLEQRRHLMAKKYISIMIP